MKRGWKRRIREWVEAGLRQRITRAGLFYAAATVMVALAAFVSANNLLFLLFAMMMAALLVSGLVSRLTLAGLELDFALPEHISARRKVAAQVMVRNEKSWMTSFSIQLIGVPPSAFSSPIYFPAIPSSTRLRETVEVRFGRRGRHQENAFEFSTQFPFGFTERRVRVTLRRDILVYPSLEPQPEFEELISTVNGELESNRQGRGSDFYRIRPYEATESSRHVDWKATAHTGELQVREFAREQDPLVEIFLDLHVPSARREWFEWAVECCAFLVWNASRKECRVRFRTQDFDLLTPVEGDVYAVLKYLALVQPRRAATLPGPGAEESFQLLFTTRPRAGKEAEWSAGPVLTPETFAAGSYTG